MGSNRKARRDQSQHYASISSNHIRASAVLPSFSHPALNLDELATERETHDVLLLLLPPFFKLTSQPSLLRQACSPPHYSHPSRRCTPPQDHENAHASDAPSSWIQTKGQRHRCPSSKVRPLLKTTRRRRTRRTDGVCDRCSRLNRVREGGRERVSSRRAEEKKGRGRSGGGRKGRFGKDSLLLLFLPIPSLSIVPSTHLTPLPVPSSPSAITWRPRSRRVPTSSAVGAGGGAGRVWV